MRRFNWRTVSLLLLAFAATASVCAHGATVSAGLATGGERRTGLGTISGSVLDSRGNPVSGALVKILRDGFNEVVKETKSGSDGTFAARVTPGRYLVRALAEGFTPATFTSVQVGPSAELVYRFNLQPAGEGKTLPERRPDRNDPKWRIRASQTRRSIFNADGVEDETVRRVIEAAEEEEAARGAVEDDAMAAPPVPEDRRGGRTRTQGYVETFFANSSVPGVGSYEGLNFAVNTPVSRELNIIFSGQAGEFERMEATARLRAGARHRLSATVGGARFPLATREGDEAQPGLNRKLGQVSARVVDEWVVRDGVVLVVGLDYSKFTGAGGAHALSPRLGAAFDANARTRVHIAFAPGSDPASHAEGVDFEDGQVVFKESEGQPVAFVDGQAVMERSHRLEFGVERILDESSSVEATAFFDTFSGRGVGLLSIPSEGLTPGGSAALLDIANQQGGARGLRVVYTRRVSTHLKASAGYAFGRGQQLSPEGIDAPNQLFQDSFFQTAAASLDASVFDGTRVRTVLRFSPRASVFAIDPFAGQLAVYDPSLSILVTQELPSFGLPVRAQATIDARNLLDYASRAEGEDGSTLSVGALRRSLRGGISLRF
ncbi:MAG TPA: carboxypeptidase-like regulatory domain-containing protein [Pyrinomonadaceae bacterium]|jgi:hypothetical protein|nr:carboxypeptidase-like regulatory domain-containing protein [Pyrinomonadaceae bacterium]